MIHQISWDDFDKIDIRSGTIVNATVNAKAKIPAYVLTIDFGKEIGIKISSAQLTHNYLATELVNKKILAVVNFPPKVIAGIKSEVLVLATVSEEQGTLLVSPDSSATNGSKLR